MATKTKDGRWKATWVDQGKRKAFYSRISDEHAEELKVQAQRGQEASSIPTNENEFHECAVAHWEPSIAHLRANTKRRYADVYKRHVYPAFGKRDPATIKHSEIQAQINTIPGAATAQLTATVMVQIFKKLKRNGIVTENPAEELSLPQKERRERVMSFADMQRLLMMVDGTPLAAPVFLAGVLGFRRGEICGLRWNHIDTDTRRVSVSVQRLIRHGEAKGKKIGEGPLKRDGSKRSFELPKPFMEILLGVGDLDRLYVATNNGKPWNPERLTCMWAEKRAVLGFPDWHFHDLRHGAAGIMVAAGVDLVTIAAILGHRNINTTQLYSAVSEKTASIGLERLAKRLFPVNKRPRKVSIP